MGNFIKFLSQLEEELPYDEEIRESYVQEQYDMLLEKLITFGGKAYPKFGNVVIMAGGAGSGKGFVKNKLVGIEGYSFDVDELKKLSSKTPAIVKKVKDELGIDLTNLSKDLTNPENVSKLHEIIGDYLSLDDKKTEAFYKSVMSQPSDRKPNIIFDVTLKDLRKLQKITTQVKNLGYSSKNIHIVWVVNDIEVAKSQNKNPKRGRVVPAEILVNTHRGASDTMHDIINMGSQLKRYMDGEIVFAFNKINVDTDLKKSGRGGDYIKDANYFYVKRKGKAPISQKELSSDLKRKIQSYVPPNVVWDQ